MNFTKFDMVLIFSMSLAIVLMSFAFPAMGMTDGSDKVNATDIPEFNITSDRWDIAGDFPERPGTPSSGELEYDEERAGAVQGENLLWIDRPKSEGLAIELQNDTLGNANLDIVVSNFSTTSSDTVDRYTITSEGEEVLHQDGDWVIEFDVRSIENYQQPNMTATVGWKIESSPAEDEGGLLDSIPVIGGLWNAGEELVSMLGYLGMIIRWFVATSFEIALTVITLLLDVMVYTVSMLQWLTSTYSAIISAADSWAAVLLVMPAVLLFVEFAKLGMIGISLLPLT